MGRADFGILLGKVVVAIGFVFVLVFWLAETLWGSYLGAPPGIGLTVSATVLVVGLALWLVLWIGRELGAFLTPTIDRVMGRQ